MPFDVDLLNEPIPEAWAATRHCPSCGCVDLRVSSDPIELNGWCTTECFNCGRELRKDTIDADGTHTWEDPEWVRATEQ